MKRICKGCGVELQSYNENSQGYIPKEKLISSDNIICKRCFRLKHYGENLEKEEDSKIYKLEVSKAINNADIVMPIFDIIDFESSFTIEIIDLLEDKVLLPVINKIDLLPGYIHVSEISKWVKYYLTENNIFPEDIAYISTKNRYGVNGIFRKIQYIAKNILCKKIDSNIKVAIIGVSNVGKSSLINLLLNKNISTVSKFSGTTKKSIKNLKNTKEFKITFIDTPGLIPEGRLSDLLTKDLSYKLVPSSQIPRKTFRLKENQVFMFSNLVYLKVKEIPKDKNTAIITAYASKNIKFHLTNENKAINLFKSKFFDLLDEENYNKYFSQEFIKNNFYIDEFEDLSISGLGYIEVKRGPIEIELYYPKHVKVSVRKSISKNSNFEDEEIFEEELW